ncbi:hypothetical protein O988_08717, partial [Pseudogymnoascus sp. VKM F-3808]
MASKEADNPAYYQYTPLPTEPGTIRLLHRPKDSATTQRRLMTSNFNTASQKYTAISYVWGPPSERTTYELADGAGVVQIPNSLSEALARIDDEYVWADSICINQRDDEEKAVQVQQMVDVYAHALTRIIYLFKEEPRYFDGAMGSRLSRTRHRPERFLEDELSSGTVEEKAEEAARAFEGLRFLEKMEAIGKRPKDPAGDKFWLLKVLQFRRGAGCFLPCDIIYAHLQLTKLREFRDMVSYTVPYSTAFHGVAECFMRMVTGLGILAFVEDIPLRERQARVGERDPERDGEDTMRYVRLASWAPNWT